MGTSLLVRDLELHLPPEAEAPSLSHDPGDAEFIHLALASGAPWLVSGDSDLLNAPPVPGVLMLTPAQALERLRR